MGVMGVRAAINRQQELGQARQGGLVKSKSNPMLSWSQGISSTLKVGLLFNWFSFSDLKMMFDYVPQLQMKRINNNLRVLMQFDKLISRHISLVSFGYILRLIVSWCLRRLIPQIQVFIHSLLNMQVKLKLNWWIKQRLYLHWNKVNWFNNIFHQLDKPGILKVIESMQCEKDFQEFMSSYTTTHSNQKTVEKKDHIYTPYQTVLAYLTSRHLLLPFHPLLNLWLEWMVFLDPPFLKSWTALKKLSLH